MSDSERPAWLTGDTERIAVEIVEEWTREESLLSYGRTLNTFARTSAYSKLRTLVRGGRVTATGRPAHAETIKLMRAICDAVDAICERND